MNSPVFLIWQHFWLLNVWRKIRHLCHRREFLWSGIIIYLIVFYQEILADYCQQLSLNTKSLFLMVTWLRSQKCIINIISFVKLALNFQDYPQIKPKCGNFCVWNVCKLYTDRFTRHAITPFEHDPSEPRLLQLLRHPQHNGVIAALCWMHLLSPFYSLPMALWGGWKAYSPYGRAIYTMFLDQFYLTSR